MLPTHCRSPYLSTCMDSGVLQLFVAIAAGLKPELLHNAATYGVISMDAFAWH